ncbi:MAG TPA: hypothetical protein VNO51_06925 [Ilumatobacteraceae bacterium]|nr:hypothetical protein [Ilumatobacteraceae bacterium]
MADGDGDDLDEAVTSDLDQEPGEDDETIVLDAYDLDDDGKVSIIEDARARLGVIDASLEEHAKQPGVTGAIADVAHRALDKLDND